MIDVLVIGAGISGLTTAINLAQRGARVVVLEKEHTPGLEGSSRANGSLRVQGRHDVEFAIARASIERWKKLADEADTCGYEVNFELSGNVYIASRPTEVPTLEGLAKSATTAGLDGVRVLRGDDVGEVLPGVSGKLAAALYSPVDGACDPPSVIEFLADKAVRAGVELRFGTTVRRLDEVRGKMHGVTTDLGSIRASKVVLAAGVWAPYLASPLGVDLPIMPLEMGEMSVRVRERAFEPTIRGFDFGARAQDDGLLVIGGGYNASVKHTVTLYDAHQVGVWSRRLVRHWRRVRLSLGIHDVYRQMRVRSTRSGQLVGALQTRSPKKAHLDKSLSRIQELFPVLAQTPIAEKHTWVGTVDITPDGLAIIDNDCGPDGLAVIAGLSGHGFHTAPVVGEIVADLCSGGTPEFDIQRFRLARFSEPGLEFPETIL